MGQTRNNKPITVTLSPEAIEAIDILKKELDISKNSQAIDYAIKQAIQSLGYSLKEEE